MYFYTHSYYYFVQKINMYLCYFWSIMDNLEKNIYDIGLNEILQNKPQKYIGLKPKIRLEL